MKNATIAELLYTAFRSAKRVSTDSREVEKGDLFFALRGDSFDGNSFAEMAIERGAIAAVVDDREVALSERYLLVEDALVALQQLAKYHRQRLEKLPILAITGSNGKTTTKELIAAVLERRYQVLGVTKGNLNNHIGVPITILAMGEQTELGVVEMGASALGEIALLCEIAQPNFGLITNIGRAHLEGFGSLDGVTQGKGELLDYLEAHSGVALYLEQDPTLVRMVEQRGGLSRQGYSLELGEGIRSNLTGEYNRANIAAALAIGEYFGVERGVAIGAVEGYIPINMRSQRVETEYNSVIMDCYNANPSSMESAIDNFSQEITQRVKTAILGDMLELGDHAAAEHLSLLRGLEGRGISRVLLVGELFEQAYNTLLLQGDRGGHTTEIELFRDTQSLIKYIEQCPIRESLILLKGSRSMGLDRLMKHL